MLSVALCDDDDVFLQYVKKLVYEYEYENGEFDIHTYTNPQKLMADIYEEEKFYDLILLDIQMPYIDGIEVGFQIKNKLKEAIIVFISGYDRALDAFKLNAFDYLVKPIKEDKFHETLDRCLIEYHKNKHYKDQSLYYTYKNNGQSFIMNYKNILYFEKIKNTVVLYYDQKNSVNTIYFYKSMNQVEKELEMEHFIRCHVGYIVNKNLVYHLKNRKIFIHPYNIKVEVSRNKIKEVREIIKNKLFEGDDFGRNVY